MNGPFPQVPAPFSQYGYMQQQQQPSAADRRQMMATQMAQSILGQPAQNMTQGISQLAAGIGLGLSNYQKTGQQFPKAPGGASPSFGTSLANFFTGRHNGGLY
jgi:hypothetical protein